MPRGGRIVGTQTLVNHGSPATRFDIVILGDGFQAHELAKFDAHAALLAKDLLAMPPFDQVAHLINVHTVRTISTDSGVSKFPSLNVSKRTFYGVTGFFAVQGLPPPHKGFFGTPTPAQILAAAGLVAPVQNLQLYIVVVNVNDFGFSAFPDQRMVFAARHPHDGVFVNYVAHEACHAIARTAEEYQDCNGPPPDRTYPNQMTEQQRLAGQFKWKHLAQAQELKADGTFKAVNLFSDRDVTFDPQTHTPSSTRRPELDTMLGLFWQCQDIDPTPGTCTSYEDPRGKHFYRPMATCKMRYPFSPFCRVCSAEIVAGIMDNLR